jgi:hypothetical protein
MTFHSVALDKPRSPLLSAMLAEIDWARPLSPDYLV